MNKRNTEGFVLAYVMIVIAVVSAITMALTTSTLKVLQAQEQSVERMQAKYEAMGEIERLAAALKALNASSISISGEHSNSEEDAQNEAGRKFAAFLDNESSFPYAVTQAIYYDTSHDTKPGKLEIIAITTERTSSVKIEATIIIEPDIYTDTVEVPSTIPSEPAPIDEEDDPDGGAETPPSEPPTYTYPYIVNGINSLYFESYTISTPEPEGGAA